MELLPLLTGTGPSMQPDKELAARRVESQLICARAPADTGQFALLGGPSIHGTAVHQASYSDRQRERADPPVNGPNGSNHACAQFLNDCNSERHDGAQCRTMSGSYFLCAKTDRRKRHECPTDMWGSGAD